jgi:hypothetical protein
VPRAGPTRLAVSFGERSPLHLLHAVRTNIQTRLTRAILGISGQRPLIQATMSTALIIALIVIAIVAGTIFTLKSTTRTGMPSQEVLKRASRRARELEARDQSERDK